MASTLSGNVNTATNLSISVPAAGSILSGFNISVSQNTNGLQSYTTGTGANQIQKIMTVTGTLNATSVLIDLSAGTSSGSTTGGTCYFLDPTVAAGFSNVREIVIFNLDTAAVLTWDPSTSTTNTVLLGMQGTLTGITFQIQAGGCWRFTQPLGASGYVISGSVKILKLTSGVSTGSYQVIVAGN